MTDRPINLTDWQVRAALDGRLSLVVEPVKLDWKEGANREFSGWRPEQISKCEWLLIGGISDGARITNCRATGDRLFPSMPIPSLNSNPADNAPENLDWGTQEDNWTDRLVNGKETGEQHHSSKLTESDVQYIRLSEKSQRALARHFGVRQSTIWSVKNDISWRENPVQSPPNLPRWASRLTLIVTDVRVMRVQEIGEDQASATGLFKPYDIPLRELVDSPLRTSLQRTWNARHAKRGLAWDANPWVTATNVTVHRSNIDDLEGV